MGRILAGVFMLVVGFIALDQLGSTLLQVAGVARPAAGGPADECLPAGPPGSTEERLDAFHCASARAAGTVVAAAASEVVGEAALAGRVASARRVGLVDDAASAAAAVREAGSELEGTIVRVQRNGPFPYAQDGSIFRNSERRLPPGDYREYTVETPGAPDRGSRRVVHDLSTGSLFYTPDHYQSFIRMEARTE